MAISSIHSPEKRLNRRSVDIRPIPTKQVYQMSIIQDVNTSGSKATTTPRLLDSLSRSQGWLLAHSCSTKQKTLSRLQVQGPKLAVSGDALRPKRGSTFLYQGDVTCGTSTSSGRNMVPTIPGRSPYYRTNQGLMPSPNTKGTANHDESRVHHKRVKISHKTRPELRMARYPMGSTNTHGPSGTKKSSEPSRRSNSYSSCPILHKTYRNETSRSGKLDRTVRSSCENAYNYYKTHPEILQKSSSRHGNRNSKKFENAPLQLDLKSNTPSTAGIAYSRLHNSNGRFLNRMGLPNQPKPFSRSFRSHNVLFHQRLRAPNNLVCPDNYFRNRCRITSSVRQHHSLTSVEKRRIYEFSPVLSDRVDLAESSTVQVDSKTVTHPRKLQCPSRPAVKEYTTINRMGNYTSRFSEDPQLEPTSTGGSFCDKSQQQIGHLHITMPRSRSNSSGCSDNIMGEMGSPLSVSPNTPDFEGFGQNDQYQIYERFISHTRNANQTLVYGSQTTGSTLNTLGSTAPPDCNRQSRIPTPHYETSRLAVIKAAYQIRFPNCNRSIDLLSVPLRKSSIENYESKWARLCNFLKDHNISPCDLKLDNILEFFSHLFHEKNLRPCTIAHYRSALSVPLELQFKINLHDSAVTDLLKAMQIKRPNIPVAAPSWNLNKVLTILDSWTGKISEEQSLQKTAFLLLLATGWRISELHACVREKEFCHFTYNSTLMLRPHPSFLAKNECPKQRWSHRAINHLQLADGTNSQLCPVRSLQEYLRRTSQSTKGNIFIHPSTRKPLTIHQLSKYICKFIDQADPATGPKVHDIRKYAASCTLAETMEVTEMVNALQWSSPHTFWKYYLAPTVPLAVPVILPSTNERSLQTMALNTSAASVHQLADESSSSR